MPAIDENTTAALRYPAARRSPGLARASDSLGPLADLLGTWVGTKGVNMVTFPFPSQGEAASTPLVREYLETITFSPIGADVPNRRAGGIDYVAGVMYQLFSSDIATNQPMHVENGMWLMLDQATKRSSVARLASVPHGDSVLAIGDWGKVEGGPIYPPIRALPGDRGPARPRKYPKMKTGQFDPNKPEATLESEIAGQDVLHTTYISVSTFGGGGVLNTPLLDRKASTIQFDCLLWVETIRDAANPGRTFQLLQYAQTSTIEFPDDPKAPSRRFRSPHVNLNTLVKQ